MQFVIQFYPLSTTLPLVVNCQAKTYLVGVEDPAKHAPKAPHIPPYISPATASDPKEKIGAAKPSPAETSGETKEEGEINTVKGIHSLKKNYIVEKRSGTPQLPLKASSLTSYGPKNINNSRTQ